MSAAAQRSRLANTVVAEHWDKQFAKIRADNSCWINNDIVANHLNHLISGGTSNYWLSWLFEDYFRDIDFFERSFSLCCGDASHELAMYQSKRVKFVRGFDLSPGAIRQANDRFVAAGVTAGTYLFEIKDANQLDVQDSFDLVMANSALHHVTELEDLLGKVRAMLRPKGYFVVLEFVGPNRFQWTARQCELINGILAQLDLHYLKDHVRAWISAPPVEEMHRIDPSEAVRSQEVVPLIRSYFDVEYERPFNGTLMHMLYPLLHANLGNKGRRDFDSMVRLILYFEDVMIQSGYLSSDFTFMICRAKGRKVNVAPSVAPVKIAAPTSRTMGFVDACTPTSVVGWAIDLECPDQPVSIDIRLNGKHVGKMLCDGLRKDVQAAGYGNGLSGFTYYFVPPGRPLPGSRVEVSVCGTQTLIGTAVVAMP